MNPPKDGNQDPSSNPNPNDDGDGGVSDELKAAVSKIANAAQSSHATRMNKHFDKRFSEIQETITQSVSAQLEALKEALSGTGKPPDAKPAELEQMQAKYAKQIETLQAKVEAADRAREEEKSRASRNEERSALTDALRAGGVDGPLLKSAIALLFTEEKRIGRGDDGSIVFKTTKDGFDEEMSIKDGVAEWLTSEEGKHYAPARPVAGSGNTGGALPRGKQPRTKMDALRELQEKLWNGELS